jgi:hypothetical protein
MGNENMNNCNEMILCQTFSTAQFYFHLIDESMSANDHGIKIHFNALF